MKVLSSNQWQFPRYSEANQCFFIVGNREDEILIVRRGKYICEDEDIVLFLNAETDEKLTFSFSAMKDLRTSQSREAKLNYLYNKYTLSDRLPMALSL